MQHLEVSCAVRPIYGSLGAKGLKLNNSWFYEGINKTSGQKHHQTYFQVRPSTTDYDGGA
jgi:hypothetical protein